MTSSNREHVTELLRAARGEGDLADSQLLPLVYQDLRRIADSIFAREASGHTLQPTAVVHEAWMKLGLDGQEFEDRGHFFGVAARAMRQVLVDHARARKAQKRGQAADRITLDPELALDTNQVVDVLALDSALTKLAETYERQARVAELRFLTGLDVEEVAAALGISEKTVRRDWRFARAWLQRELAGDEAAPDA